MKMDKSIFMKMDYLLIWR